MFSRFRCQLNSNFNVSHSIFIVVLSSLGRAFAWSSLFATDSFVFIDKSERKRQPDFVTSVKKVIYLFFGNERKRLENAQTQMTTRKGYKIQLVHIVAVYLSSLRSFFFVFFSFLSSFGHTHTQIFENRSQFIITLRRKIVFFYPLRTMMILRSSLATLDNRQNVPKSQFDSLLATTLFSLCAIFPLIFNRLSFTSM